MSAANVTLPIEQGGSLRYQAVLKDANGAPIDLTGWTFRGQIRKLYSASEKICDLTLELNSPATDGVLWIILTAAQTAAIPVDAASTYRKTKTTYAYDVEAVRPDTTVIRVLEGAAEISPEVTR